MSIYITKKITLKSSNSVTFVILPLSPYFKYVFQLLVFQLLHNTGYMKVIWQCNQYSLKSITDNSSVEIENYEEVVECLDCNSTKVH